MNVAVIGASDKPERYSYKAVKLLTDKGHTVFPVHKRIQSIGDLKVYSSIGEIKEPMDTVTLYVASDISSQMTEDILKMRPKRVIFNPGTENPNLYSALNNSGITVINACTLVLLNTNQF